MASSGGGSASTWNWHPPLPLADVPYWAWPPPPLALALAKWLIAYFSRPTDRLLYLLFALCVGFWLEPVTGAIRARRRALYRA